MELIYARRETARQKVFESDPKIRRVKVEMELINEPIPDNNWRIRNLQLEIGARKEGQRETTRGVETHSKSSGVQKDSTRGIEIQRINPAQNDRVDSHKDSTRGVENRRDSRTGRDSRESSLVDRVVLQKDVTQRRGPRADRESIESSISGSRSGHSELSISSTTSNRLRQHEEELRIQNLEIELLQQKVENRKKLVALKLMMAEDTEKGVTKSDSTKYV